MAAPRADRVGERKSEAGEQRHPRKGLLLSQVPLPVPPAPTQATPGGRQSWGIYAPATSLPEAVSVHQQPPPQ